MKTLYFKLGMFSNFIKAQKIIRDKRGYLVQKSIQAACIHLELPDPSGNLKM